MVMDTRYEQNPRWGSDKKTLVGGMERQTRFGLRIRMEKEVAQKENFHPGEQKPKEREDIFV